jgi:hypothetical protein
MFRVSRDVITYFALSRLPGFLPARNTRQRRARRKFRSSRENSHPDKPGNSGPSNPRSARICRLGRGCNLRGRSPRAALNGSRRVWIQCVLSVTSLNLNHALPVDLFRRHARSPMGHNTNKHRSKAAVRGLSLSTHPLAPIFGRISRAGMFHSNAQSFSEHSVHYRTVSSLKRW